MVCEKSNILVVYSYCFSDGYRATTFTRVCFIYVCMLAVVDTVLFTIGKNMFDSEKQYNFMYNSIVLITFGWNFIGVDFHVHETGS